MSGLLVGFNAWAQAVPGQAASEAAPPAPTARASTGSELSTVVITAQKRPESVQKASIAISAIDGSAINEFGQNALDDVLKDLPGVVMQATARGLTPSIRGLGTDLPPGIGDGAVATNFDGIYNVRAEGSQIVYDIARVEVLRGPQSTLYGRSGPAGIVNVISNDPSFKREGSATFEAGNFNLFRSELMFNQPLSEKVAVRAAFSSVNRDGYMSNGTNDAKSVAGRVKLLYKPSEDMSLLIGVEALKIGGIGSGAVPAYVEAPDDPYLAVPSPGQYDRYRSNKYWAQLDANIGFARVTVLVSTADARNKQFVPPGTSPSNDDGMDPKRLDQNSLEVRLSSPSTSQLKWLLGAYYYDNDMAVTQLSNNPGSVAINQHTTARSKALFGNISYPVTDGLRVLAGLRTTKDDKSYANDNFVPHADFSDSFKRIDSKLGIEVDTGAQSMLYATASTGYRPGTWSQMPPYEPVKMETVNALEFGSKNQFLNNRLRVNGSFYYYDYKNYQIADLFFDPMVGRVVLTFQNIAKARNYGGEVEASWRVSVDDKVGLAVGYVNATFRSDATIHADPGAPAMNLNGRAVPHSPNWTVSANYERHVEFASGAELTARLSARHVSAQYVSPNAQPLSYQKGYSTGDATLVYRPAKGDWSLTGYVKNVNDVAVKTNFIAGWSNLAPPRTYGLIGSVNF
ncbi:TonB-dependent receptor [Massilia sp. DWR3-1-1]|uniref:TonB-dependent receptor n=1 Tax=Massilia sp. DWR3-1-1 TaxID=2804559 RepID=UPI003CEEDBCD